MKTKNYKNKVKKMLNIEKQIKTKLSEVFKPDFLEVKNESYKHNVPPGSESHFRITVITQKFNSMTLIKRHQMINEVLKDELSGQVHALSIRAKTPEQWKSDGRLIQPTPLCNGS